MCRLLKRFLLRCRHQHRICFPVAIISYKEGTLCMFRLYWAFRWDHMRERCIFSWSELVQYTQDSLRMNHLYSRFINLCTDRIHITFYLEMASYKLYIPDMSRPLSQSDYHDIDLAHKWLDPIICNIVDRRRMIHLCPAFQARCTGLRCKILNLKMP